MKENERRGSNEGEIQERLKRRKKREGDHQGNCLVNRTTINKVSKTRNKGRIEAGDKEAKGKQGKL